MIHEHKPKIKHYNHNHTHHHTYSHRVKEKKRLLLVIYITGITMLIEIVGGIISGSLALISDAGHMFTHAFALLVSFIAIILASKPADMHKTFGYYRIEILAALFNSIMLLLVTVWIFYEAYKRVFNPMQIKGTEMLVVSIVGLIVNVVSAIILLGASKEDINVRSAFLHMVGDTASSIAVILGAVIVLTTGWTLVDPILSALIAVVILIWAYKLARESIQILLEAAPSKIDVNEVKQNILKFQEVKEITDIHIWTITSNMYSLMAHIRVVDDLISKRKTLIDDIDEMLYNKFDIIHTSIQFSV
ncbi:MAG: cation transporter [Candidatus Cloacimonadota bacterium]|nr:MAG: cation transporter [Candidatus Cloacimonadota bacterium]